MTSGNPLDEEYPFGNSRNVPLHKSRQFNKKHSEYLWLQRIIGDLARMLITPKDKVNTPRSQKKAPAAESGSKRRKRIKDKLVRSHGAVQLELRHL